MGFGVVINSSARLRKASVEPLVIFDRGRDGTLTKNSDAADEFLRSNDLELATKCDLFCEVPRIGGEKPVGSRVES